MDIFVFSADAKEGMMSDRGFTTAFRVDQTPQEAFAAINNVRGWWTGKPGAEGSTDKLGDEFTYRYDDVHYSKQKVTDLVPGRKVAWRITDARLSFTKDQTEWKGTEVIFEIAKKGGKTEVRFTHAGLVPAFECFDACSNAWGSYIKGNLRSLITTGEGKPSTTASDSAMRTLDTPLRSPPTRLHGWQRQTGRTPRPPKGSV